MPFVCVGEAGDSPALVFRKTDETTPTSRVVAKAFWAILTEHPARLGSLNFLWYDGYGYESDWGSVCTFDNRVVVSDTHDEDPEADEGRTAPHAVPLWYPDGLPCPECSGVGEESFDPAGEPCGYCDGTGFAD